MDPSRIAGLLAPFLGPAALDPAQLRHISTYIDILARWNRRIALTSVTAPDNIVTRHFGESLFAARSLFPSPDAPSPRDALIDLGSGAGFPGLPIKIWRSELPVTLIESNQKKATFLREVIRALALPGAHVYAGRAESFLAPPPGDDPANRSNVPAGTLERNHHPTAWLTLRAVERFESVLPVAASLLRPSGTLALLISQPQIAVVKQRLDTFLWSDPLPIPLSDARVLLTGTKPSGQSLPGDGY